MNTLAGRLLDIAPVAERLAISQRQVRRLVASGKIGACKIGRLVRIPEAELDRLIQATFRPAAADSGPRRQLPFEGIEAVFKRTVERHRRQTGGAK